MKNEIYILLWREVVSNTGRTEPRFDFAVTATELRTRLKELEDRNRNTHQLFKIVDLHVHYLGERVNLALLLSEDRVTPPDPPR